MELEEEKQKRKRREFSLSAMKHLIDENGFLKSKYDKLSVNAEERFGYHWNEVICNVLFNKYVKSDQKLTDRYKSLKLRHDLEKDRTDLADSRPERTITEPTEKKEIKDQKMDINKEGLNEMSAGGGNSVGDGAPTGNASGAYETPVAWSSTNISRKFFKSPIIKGAKIIDKNVPDNNMNLKEDSTLDSLFESFHSLMNELENSAASVDSQAKVLKYHIVTNNENDFYADVRDSEGNTVFEIKSNDEINKLIQAGSLKSKEDVEGLGTILKSQGVMSDNDVLELAEMNEKEALGTITQPIQTLGVVNENVKPNGLVQAERVKAVNAKNSLNYYKTLNDGIQDLIKIEKPVNVVIDATIKYEYDNNGQDVNNGVFPDAEKFNNEYIETAKRGTEDYILDRPDTIYDKRLEKMVGTKAYNILKDKQKVIMNKDLRNTPKGKVEVVDKSVNESYLSGFYLDGFGNKKIKTVAISNVQEIEILSEDTKHFETKGVGNGYNEVLKEQIEEFNFYYNTKENSFVKIQKEKDSNKQKNMLNESSIKKAKYLIGYDPSKSVKNLIDRSKL